MLERMTLRNFKSWRDVCLDLKPVTLVFGANSSGKTALLDALVMLKQTAESNDRGLSISYGWPYVDLGSFGDVIHRREEDRELGIELRWRPRQDVVLREEDDEGPRVTAKAIQYTGAWRRSEDVALSLLEYRTDEVQMRLTRRSDGKYRTVVTGPPPVAKKRVGRSWPLPNPESCYALPRQVARDWPHADLLEFNHQFELLMDRIRYLGPLREPPRRVYQWTGEAPSMVLPDGTGAVDALVADARYTHRRPKQRGSRVGLVAQVAQWLQKLGLTDAFSVRPVGDGGRLYEVWVRAPGAATESLLPDVGFGLSQLLPVLVQLQFAPEGSILLFEQPELHLHPGIEALLADLFLEVAFQRNLQVIVESHSEYLLTRLQRHVAEAVKPYASPANIALYFCELRDGESRRTPLSVNLLGEIANWPDGFFGDSIGDLEAMTAAIVRREREREAS